VIPRPLLAPEKSRTLLIDLARGKNCWGEEIPLNEERMFIWGVEMEKNDRGVDKTAEPVGTLKKVEALR